MLRWVFALALASSAALGEFECSLSCKFVLLQCITGQANEGKAINAKDFPSLMACVRKAAMKNSFNIVDCRLCMISQCNLAADIVKADLGAYLEANPESDEKAYWKEPCLGGEGGPNNYCMPAVQEGFRQCSIAKAFPCRKPNQEACEEVKLANTDTNLCEWVAAEGEEPAKCTAADQYGGGFDKKKECADKDGKASQCTNLAGCVWQDPKCVPVTGDIDLWKTYDQFTQYVESIEDEVECENVGAQYSAQGNCFIHGDEKATCAMMATSANCGKALCKWTPANKTKKKDGNEVTTEDKCSCQQGAILGCATKEEKKEKKNKDKKRRKERTRRRRDRTRRERRRKDRTRRRRRKGDGN